MMLINNGKCGFVVAHVTSISLSMFARLAPSPDVTRAGSNIQRMRAQSEHSLHSLHQLLSRESLNKVTLYYPSTRSILSVTGIKHVW